MDFAALATKYVGHTAWRYDGRRDGERKWRAEEEAAAELLQEVRKGARTLDIPVGTGRLLSHLKERRFAAHGLDVSPDMLAIARARASATSTEVDLGIGDIRAIPFDDGHFELVTCLRFLNWIDAEGVEQTVKELARVSSDKLLLGIRYLTPIDELKRGRAPVVCLGMRAFGLTRLRARRHGLYVHHKEFIDGLFERVGFEIVSSQHIERRFDGTDYVFFLLRKRSSPDRVTPISIHSPSPSSSPSETGSGGRARARNI